MAYLIVAFVGYFYVVVAAGMPMIRYFIPALPLLLAAATAGLHRSMLRETTPATR